MPSSRKFRPYKEVRRYDHTFFSDQEIEDALNTIPTFLVQYPDGKQVSVIALPNLIPFIAADNRNEASSILNNLTHKLFLVPGRLVRDQYPNVSFGNIKNFIVREHAFRILRAADQSGHLTDKLPADFREKYPKINPDPHDLESDEDENPRLSNKVKFSLDNFDMKNEYEYLRVLQDLGVEWESLPKLLRHVQDIIAERNFLKTLDHSEVAEGDLWKKEHMVHLTAEEESSAFQLYAAAYLAKKQLQPEKTSIPYLDPEFINWEMYFESKNPKQTMLNLCGVLEHLEALLIFANIGLIKENIPYQAKDNLDSFKEYISIGKLTLYKILKKFDIRRKNKFSTFATYWLNRKFKNAQKLSSGVYYPRHYDSSFSKIRIHAAAHNVSPMNLSPEELSSLGISAGVYEMYRILRTNGSEFISLDSPYGRQKDASDRLLEEILDAERNADLESDTTWESFSREEKRKLLARMIYLRFNVSPETVNKMENGHPVNNGERLGIILALRYGLFSPNMSEDGEPDITSVNDLAVMFSVSGERVKQLEKQALSYIRKSSAATQALNEFLGKNLR